MLVNTTNQVLKFKFHYSEDKVGRRVTECSLYDQDGDVVSVGKALCAKEDHFSRVIGRKIALANALKQANFDKEVRTQIWNFYKNNCKFVS